MRMQNLLKPVCVKFCKLLIFFYSFIFYFIVFVCLFVCVFVYLFIYLIYLYIYFSLYFEMETRNFLNTKIISDATYDTAIAPVKYSSKRHYAT